MFERGEIERTVYEGDGGGDNGEPSPFYYLALKVMDVTEGPPAAVNSCYLMGFPRMA